jgi:hypothetical protein
MRRDDPFQPPALRLVVRVHQGRHAVAVPAMARE